MDWASARSQRAVQTMIDELLHGEDRGVSPVIGVILMVAITVILAAVIGTFVLNLGGSVQENIQAGANIECNGDGSGDTGTIKVTWTSNQNADKLNVSSSDTGELSMGGGVTSTGSVYSAELTSVGQSVTFEESNTNSVNIDITVTGVSGQTSTVVSTKTCEEI